MDEKVSDIWCALRHTADEIYSLPIEKLSFEDLYHIDKQLARVELAMKNRTENLAKAKETEIALARKYFELEKEMVE